MLKHFIDNILKDFTYSFSVEHLDDKSHAASRNAAPHYNAFPSYPAHSQNDKCSTNFPECQSHPQNMSDSLSGTSDSNAHSIPNRSYSSNSAHNPDD